MCLGRSLYLVCTCYVPGRCSAGPGVCSPGSGEDGGAAAWLRPCTGKPAAIAVRARGRGGRQARQACRAWAPCPVNPCSRCAGRRRGCPPGTARQAPGSPLGRRPYDLRHAAVSLWLNSGVAATEVARRAGHGVAVLLKIYAHCIDGQADAANHRITDALDTPDAEPDDEEGDDTEQAS
jgi:hypothetical protein